ASQRGFPVPHRTDGFPKLMSWPAWNSIDHQMMYVDWLYRAYKAGLRLMVVHAVNAEAICGLAVVRKAPGRTCDDMEAVDLQLAEARRLEAYVDRMAGGKREGGGPPGTSGHGGGPRT